MAIDGKAVLCCVTPMGVVQLGPDFTGYVFLRDLGAKVEHCVSHVNIMAAMVLDVVSSKPKV